MPNNNPGGHNQYSKSDSSSPKSQTPIAKSQQAHADGATPANSTGESALLASGSATGDTNAGASAPAPRSENNPGNFANDRERARTAGRKGGEAHGSNR